MEKPRDTGFFGAYDTTLRTEIPICDSELLESIMLQLAQDIQEKFFSIQNSKFRLSCLEFLFTVEEVCYLLVDNTTRFSNKMSIFYEIYNNMPNLLTKLHSLN